VLTVVGGLLAMTGGPAAAGAAAAAQPCWRTLLEDWNDGRIDRVYPVTCYRLALERLPEDVRAYSSAEDDIRAALQTRPLSGGSEAQGEASSSARRLPDGPVSSAIARLSSGDATSPPIAPLVGTGLALLLLTAGLARVILRRARSRTR
jgi:hypothetical protein